MKYGPHGLPGQPHVRGILPIYFKVESASSCSGSEDPAPYPIHRVESSVKLMGTLSPKMGWIHIKGGIFGLHSILAFCII